MKAGTILYAGTNVGLYGTPTFTMQRTPSPAPPALATHWQVEITVAVELHAEMPATLWAKAKALQGMLTTTPKGLLEIRDENGTAVSWMASPAGDNLPETLSRKGGRLILNFTATQPVAEGNYPLGITVDPLNGEDPISIPRPMTWAPSVSISRADGRHAIRSEITTRITFTARTAYADPLADPGTRAEQLMAEVERLRALNSKEARLTFADFDKVVQIESFSATPSEGWDYIDLTAQCRYVSLPGEDEAEVAFTVKETQDPATGETRITVAGSVKSPDSILAEAKVEALLIAFRTSSRRLTKFEKEDIWADGADVEDPAWLGLSFSIELVEPTSDTRYTVRIDTREGADGTRVTYAGSAQAANLGILLATVETAAGNKHPVEVRAELSVEWATDDEGTLKLVSGTFSREYQTASTKIRGEIRRTTSQGAFGDWTAAINGSLTAANAAAARVIARSFIPAGVILRTDDENSPAPFVADGSGAVTEQFAALDFSYSWGTDHTYTAISYKDGDSPDYSKMVNERTISGTIWAPSKEVAISQLAALLISLSLANPTKQSLTATHERTYHPGSPGTTADRWLSYDFSYTFETGITGTIGHDIIEAQWSSQRIGQVNHEPITEVPLAMPVKQGAFGHNIGRMTISGTVKARVQATAIAWGQAKQGQATAGGSPDPPDERITITMLPFNGVTAAFYEFSFSYPYRYASGLTGLMSAGT